MKKVLLLSFILGIFTQSSHFAEVVPVKKKMGEKWGLKLGVGSSSFSNNIFQVGLGASYSNVSGSLESLTGISFGLISPYYPLSFNDQFSVHGELLLVLKGYQYREKGYYTPRTFLFRQRYSFYDQETYSYLEIPLFLNYQFSKKYGFRGYLGPYVALELSNKVNLEYKFEGNTILSGEGKATKTNTFGFGLATGLSYEWEKFSADLRYETSLTDCFNSVSGKLSTFSVSGAYLF